ncbi:Protein of unknown function [Gryllus bimaculatus]|nr:Protein of unknown function [Gryllus bimaculatus]
MGCCGVTFSFPAAAGDKITNLLAWSHPSSGRENRATQRPAHRVLRMVRKWGVLFWKVSKIFHYVEYLQFKSNIMNYILKHKRMPY